MAVTVREITQRIEDLAPLSGAAPWDNPGLQVGSPSRNVRGVLVALDATPAVVEEALGRGADLIVTHHPLFFRPLPHLRTDKAAGRLLARIVQSDLAVYAAHTNLDVAAGGVTAVLARTLGIRGGAPLEPLEADPSTGWGWVGDLERPAAAAELARVLKRRLRLRALRRVGRPRGRVRRVACCGGSGGELVEAVAASGAELYVTGDLKYHQALAFRAEGIPVLDIGHFGSEQGIRPVLARLLRRIVRGLDPAVPVHVARAESDPFETI